MNRTLNFTNLSLLSLLFIFLWGCNNSKKQPKDITANRIVPNELQINYQSMEMVGFVHFTVNTFTNKEWGFGDEDPQIFNPTQLDTRQWAAAAKAGGLKELILTAKHHDGFCLWPSKFTEHSIKNSPYKNGQGDIVAEFVEACRAEGLKVGLYLSPWDRNHADYGKPEYIEYYRNQLEELLTQYGEINEIWFDGANGGTGFYGGANEERKIDRTTYYDWETTIALIRKWQPQIQIFSDAGTDIRWIGNESGFAGSTFWSTITRKNIVVGQADTKYLNTGEPNGDDWVVGQCDVSIRPGWFYHEAEDSLVKSPQQLVDIYYKSVGRNAVLLLNLPPNPLGLLHETDVQNLKTFKQIIDKTFSENLAKNAQCKANSTYENHPSFSPQNLLDGDPETYWASDSTVQASILTLEFSEQTTFDRILLQEPIRFGQRISRFRLEVKEGENWKPIFEGTTIGYKRLIRIPVVSTTALRLQIMDSNNHAALSTIGVYKAAEEEGSLADGEN